MKWWNNGSINKRAVVSPGPEFFSGRLYFKRSSPTKETREKTSHKLRGRPTWNKGIITGPESETTKLRKSIAAKRRDNSVYEGITPWNKGKVASSDPRVLSYTIKGRGQKRKGNYTKGNLHPSWNPNLKQYKRYRYEVMLITERNFAKHHRAINPNNFPRTLAGVPKGYHLDHIKSVKVGFLKNISPEDIAAKENLQMLPWIENIRKGSS